VLKGIGHGCDEEAARVVSKFPKWTPGKQDGKAVSVKYTIPIKFLLAEVGEDTSTDKGTTVVGFKPVSQNSQEVPLLAETFEDRTDLTVGEGSDSRIVIRGAAGEKQPLYILDGEVMDKSFSANTINPNTIKSISVFKGSDAEKLYGSKGANGVVLINSKNK